MEEKGMGRRDAAEVLRDLALKKKKIRIKKI
jgi:hypothetical protein